MLIQHQLLPLARIDIVKLLHSKHIRPSSMIDISDGLSPELQHICRHSNTGALIHESRIPIHPATRQIADELQEDALTWALTGGEDYQLLFTLSKEEYEAIADKKVIEHAVGDLTKVAGQKPVVTKARKAIAGFKIRQGYPIGAMVTLRGQRMYEFLDRFITVALPRVRDFRGISGKAFDGRGNYNIGVKEQIIFPEIEYDKIDALRGMNISITTTAKTDDEAKALLAAFKFPFRN